MSGLHLDRTDMWTDLFCEVCITKYNISFEDHEV